MIPFLAHSFQPSKQMERSQRRKRKHQHNRYIWVCVAVGLSVQFRLHVRFIMKNYAGSAYPGYIYIFVPSLSQYWSPFPIPINQSYTIHECMIYIFWNLMHVRNYCLCCVGIKVSMSSKWIWCNKTSYFDRHAFVVGWDRDIMIGKANIFPFHYLSNSHFSSHFFLFHSPPTLHFPCIAFCK